MPSKNDKPNLAAGRLAASQAQGRPQPRHILGARNYGTGRLGIVNEAEPQGAAPAPGNSAAPAVAMPTAPPAPLAPARKPPASPLPPGPALPRRPMYAPLAVAMEIPAPPLEEIAAPTPPAIDSPRARKNRNMPGQPRTHVPPGGRVHDLTGDMPPSLSSVHAVQWGGQKGVNRTAVYVAGGVAAAALVLTCIAAWPGDPDESMPRRAQAAEVKPAPAAAPAVGTSAGDARAEAGDSLANADVPPGAAAMPLSRLHRARKVPPRPAWMDPVKSEPPDVEMVESSPPASAPAADAQASDAAEKPAPAAPEQPRFVSCPPGFRLSGTVRQGNRVLANINGRFLGVGDTVNSAEVVSIDGLLVEMRRGNEKFFIGIGQESESRPAEGEKAGGGGD